MDLGGVAMPSLLSGSSVLLGTYFSIPLPSIASLVVNLRTLAKMLRFFLFSCKFPVFFSSRRVRGWGNASATPGLPRRPLYGEHPFCFPLF